MLALRSEGFGGDFRSGYEDAFKLIMELMEPPKTTMKGTINILGARWGPSPTEFNGDMDEIERLLSLVGIKVNAIIAGGCTVEQIRVIPTPVTDLTELETMYRQHIVQR